MNSLIKLLKTFLRKMLLRHKMFCLCIQKKTLYNYNHKKKTVSIKDMQISLKNIKYFFFIVYKFMYIGVNKNKLYKVFIKPELKTNF